MLSRWRAVNSRKCESYVQKSLWPEIFIKSVLRRGRFYLLALSRVKKNHRRKLNRNCEIFHVYAEMFTKWILNNKVVKNIQTSRENFNIILLTCKDFYEKRFFRFNNESQNIKLMRPAARCRYYCIFTIHVKRSLDCHRQRRPEIAA